MTPTCLHCRLRPATRSRGLCRVCYETPELRAGYSPLLSGCERGLPDQTPRCRPQPTAAPPGTEEKLLVLIGRAERGESLWHPRDADGGDPTHGPLRPARPLACDRSPW